MRFPGFEDEWEEISIGDKFDFFSTNSFSRAKLDENGEILNIHYGDIHTKFPSIVNVKKENIPFVSDEVDVEKINKYEICKNGDLLIADASEDYADIGKTIELQGITDEKVIGGLHTLLLRDNTTNNAPLFNGYLFQNEKLKKQIKIKANGISVLGISKKELEKITIKIPSKEEQKNISDLLYSIDQKISSMERKYFLFFRIREYFLSNIIPKYNQKNPCLRFNEFNDDWKENKLKNILDLIRNGTSENQVNYETNYPVSRIETVSGDKINFNKVGYVEYVDEDYKIRIGDILLTNINSMKFIGNVLYFNEKDTLYHGMNLLLLRFKDNIDKKFMYYNLKRNNILFKKMACQAVNQASVNKTTIEKMIFSIPSYEEQKKISSLLTSIDNKIRIIKEEIELNKEFKSSLLSKMFC